MDTVKDRESTAYAKKGHILTRNSGVRLAFKTNRSLAAVCALLLSILFALTFPIVAAAAPEGAAGEQEQFTGEASALPDETSETVQSENKTDNSTAKSAGSSESEDKNAKPGGRENDGFLIGAYDDPGNPEEKRGFLAQLLVTITNIIKYVFYLALVLGIGFAAIYGIKLLQTKYNTLSGMGNELINVLEVRYLAPGKAVCLVEVGGKVVMLGMAGNSINSLCEFKEGEGAEMLKQAADKKSEAMQPFQGVLDKFTKRFTSAPTKSAKTTRKRRERPSSSDADWADDLYSTGENIRKILEEIKEQDKEPKSSRPRRSRGDEEQ